MSRLSFKSIFIIITAFSFVYSGELSSRMISTGWLRSNLNKEHIKILDVRPVNKYYSNHIPGALYLNAESVRLSINGIPYLPISPESLSKLLGDLGINEKSTVIVYGGQDDLQAFYLIWLFDYIGHKDVAILEGGYEKWERESRPVTQELPQFEVTQYQMPSKMINEIRANKKDILKSIQNNSAAIIDVRPPEVYAGMEGNCKRQGHVKGAINHYWKLDIETLYQWKSIDVLRSSYSGVSQKTILVCEDGWSAAHTYFTLRYILNQNSVQLYDGGMGEWANSTDLPMEKSNTEIQVSGTNY